jgi:hypothetical protein
MTHSPSHAAGLFLGGGVAGDVIERHELWRSPPRLRGHYRSEEEIASQLIAERRRLEEAAGMAEVQVQHFRRPEERPTAEERQRVTILFGGLTGKHEKFILVGKELQGDVATKLEVFGLVDHAHYATPDLAEYAVVRNRLPHGSIRALRPAKVHENRSELKRIVHGSERRDRPNNR